MKTVYLYDPITFEFTSEYQAQENPLEPGEYILPLHSTVIPPCNTKNGEAPVFFAENGSWSAMPDFRGTKIYGVNGEEILDKLGPIPNGYSTEAPPPTVAELAAEKTAVLVNFRTLRAQMCDALSGIAGRMERAGNLHSALALDAAAQSLLDLPAALGVVAATGGKETTAAILAEYKLIAETLVSSSPSAAYEFAKLELTI